MERVADLTLRPDTRMLLVVRYGSGERQTDEYSLQIVQLTFCYPSGVSDKAQSTRSRLANNRLPQQSTMEILIDSAASGLSCM